MAVVMMILPGCATGPSIRANYDTAADFADYKTCGFVDKPGTDRARYSTLITGYIRE
jgi:hypothetical protein